jgi:glycogen debranching enzyme
VTLVEGQTFALSGRTGDMVTDLPHGLFVLDRRVLSRWELHVNGHLLEPLAVHHDAPYAACFVGRGRPDPGRADASLVVFRHRHIGWGMRERLTITNHALESAAITVELGCDSDFADLFEVKESRVRPGRSRALRADGAVLHLEDRDGSAAGTVVRFPGPDRIEAGTARWRVELGAGESWERCIEVIPTRHGEEIEPRFRCDRDDADSLPAQRMARWRATVPAVESDHDGLVRALHRSSEDLGALRIFDPEHPETPVVAAGAPWFMTVFGRDSLLTAWMTLPADHSLARGVLETLARFQGVDVDDHTEEEPGKILHEMRFASASGPGLDRADVYYGSIDATPLFVMLLAELRRWDPSDELVDRLLPHAERALEWIQHFGDRDGDGYVEYQRRSEHGLANQGWKDSWDAIRHADGTLATPPIALCEVQGYVYAAYIARAHLAVETGDAEGRRRYVELARELRRRFNEDFWLEDHGTYALGLDADKRPIAALASNVGHCLWTGIVDPDRAAQVGAALVGEAMFSGWGIRTLASSMRAYNPVSYHNGSVWPHDNSLCAAGLARYGLVDEAHRVISAQLEAAEVHNGRLPELFAGFERSQLAVPAAYPTSCSPQAWAAAAPLSWLRTILRLDPWAPHGRVWIDPRLPEGIGRLRVAGIAVGDATIDVDVEGDRVAVDTRGRLSVVREPRPPLSAFLEQG